MNTLISYIALFLLIFDIVVPGFSFIPSSCFSLMLSLGNIIYKKKSLLPLKVIFFYKEVFIIYVSILVFVYFRVIWSYDQSFLLSTVKSSVILVSSVFYIIAFHDSKTVTKLFNIFFINSIICFIFGTFSEYKYLLNPFQHSTELIGFNPYRNSFLSGSGYFGIAVPYIFMFCYIFKNLLDNRAFNLTNTVKLSCIFFASILAGRISIVMFFLFFLFILIKSRNISLLIILAVLVSISYALLQLDMFETANAWISEMFLSDNSFTESSSISALKKMFVNPDNDLTVFFGDGIFQLENGKYYMETDVGFLRHLYFGGVFIMVAPLFIMPIFYMKNKDRFYIYFLFPMVLLCHIKGLALLNNPALMPLIFIISYDLYICRLEKV